MRTVEPYHRPTQEPFKKVYVSLVGLFQEYFLEETIGNGGRFKDEKELRLYMNAHYKKWWMTVYPEDARDHLEKSGMKCINEDQFLEKLADKGIAI